MSETVKPHNQNVKRKSFTIYAISGLVRITVYTVFFFF